ncbi:MAG TPA: hypothetical protein VME66_02390 [Candidatus Acidoferrales bacterium]|nr:hypothetical protein [Candidatus Acidoferrales bacterium]
MLRQLFYALAFVAIWGSAMTPAAAQQHYAQTPPGGHYKECHGYILHISADNVRVHCLDGVPANLSFLSYPKYTSYHDGRTVQSKHLKPGTPVHIWYSQTLGIRHAFKIFVADPHGHGLYGFKT